ncbi:toll/interleukin-1 receptor domain-containing protein [Pedobacter rhodius]|uniref:Toll/interleukin-1 receptor domain-containing protein n=1 Tax=Pedobacter rhodius TaxID=3004098 RepID=A0ABT4KVE4_9SPHI|nr:toll/interleukin-1 receptor domain-containing protein [Pedobacter sp. SJ11]MCZ4222904.1 toll/interleukin-1 receptor domain-containing protein [Pedobacter sp. SJ11]
METVFISYGGPDEKFAYRLNKFLNDSGVRTFFFPLHAKPGEKLHRVMRDNINNFAKVIFICSETSLNRAGLLNELEETLQREAREGGKSILIPITLDNYVFTNWIPPSTGVKQAVQDRVIADFSGARYGQKKFLSGCKALLSAIGHSVSVSYDKAIFKIVLDETGKNAIWISERQFTPNIPLKSIFYRGYNTTGSIEYVASHPDAAVIETSEGGAKSFQVEFDHILPVGKKMKHVLELLNKDAYLKETEDFSYLVSYSYNSVEIHIVFPKNRQVKKAKLKCIRNGITFDESNLIKYNFIQDAISVVLDRPVIGDTYYLIWNW